MGSCAAEVQRGSHTGQLSEGLQTVLLAGKFPQSDQIWIIEQL